MRIAGFEPAVLDILSVLCLPFHHIRLFLFLSIMKNPRFLGRGLVYPNSCRIYVTRFPALILADAVAGAVTNLFSCRYLAV